MKFSFIHKKGPPRKKIRRELDARRYWTILLSFFTLLLALELGYFSWLFLTVNRMMDAPATPTLETSAGTIKSMERTLSEIEMAIGKRTGKTVESSQNNSSVVQ